jgi:hypothetical protein
MSNKTQPMVKTESKRLTIEKAQPIHRASMKGISVKGKP